MKKITKAGIALTLALSLVFMLNSCEKLVDDATETTETAEDVTSDMVALASLTDALQDIVSTDPNMQLKTGTSIIPRELMSYVGDDSVFTDGTGIRIRFEFEDQNHPDYPYVSIADEPTPGTGTVCGDGTTRWGSGFIKISAPYDDPNCVISVELNRYIVLKEGIYYRIDDGKSNKRNKDEFKLTRTGADSWELAYNFSIESRKNGKTVLKKGYSTGVFEMTTKDGGQEGILDDELTISGVADECESSGGKGYTMTINTSLKRVVDPACSNTFVSGDLKIKNNGSKFDIEANFGDGTCDNLVEITLPGGVKKTISVE